MFLINYFRNVWISRHILLSLIRKDIKYKYKKTFLGRFWSLLQPLGMTLIIGFVYSILWSISPKEFIPKLFTGILPWTFMLTCADGGANSFSSAEGYIKQTLTPPEIFPIRTCGVAFINYLYGAAAFFIVFIFLSPSSFSPKMFMLFPGLAIIFLFGVGYATLSAIINIHVQDWQPFQGIILQGFFYATPIIYDSKLLFDKGYQLLYHLNPFYYFIEIIKKPMLGTIPPLRVYAMACGIALTVFLAGTYALHKFGRKIVFKF